MIRISQEGFQDVSTDILQQERLLNSLGLTHLTTIIRRVQELEKENLEVTVRLLQTRLQAVVRSEVSFESEIEELNKRYGAHKKTIFESMR